MNEMETTLREFMDLNDRQTLNTVVSVCEAGNNQFIIALTNKLYDMIRKKVDRVDYSYVMGSRGDITKIPNYDDLNECLEIIRKIVIQYKQSTAPVDTVLTAIQNLVDRKKLFTRAFAINSPLPILTYNSIALAIVQSVSYLIATSIEFIKDPTIETFQMALDVTAYRKTSQNLLFTNLEEFNKSCKSKEFDIAMGVIMDKTITKEASEVFDGTVEPKIEPLVLNKTIDSNVIPDSPFLTKEEIENDGIKVIHDVKEKAIKEGVISSTIAYGLNKAWMAILNIIIPIVRRLTYSYYFNRQKMSDYYQMQADFLAMNITNLQYNTNLTDEEKKRIIDRQKKQMDKFRKRANDLSIDINNSTNASDKLSSEESRKFTASEIDYDSDDEYTGSSLF